MEVYILDSLYRRDTVVDRFESLIWTERWQAVGDFELVIRSTPATRKQFATGVKLAVNVSHRVMTVETVEDATSEDGKATLTVKGRSLEAILDDRAAMQNMTGATWVITNKPADVARAMFDYICRTGSLNAGDVIPLLVPGSFLENDTIEEPPDTITWNQDPDTLYAAIKKICEIYDLGFRLTREYDTTRLYFDVYSGSNRTTQQTLLAPVVFSTDLDNLQNTTELTTIADAKNTAYVYSTQGNRVVYAAGVDPEVEGFERRVLIVQAEALAGSPTTAQINTYLDQVGMQALSEHRTWSAFDGEHSQNSGYVYGIHYNLGDLVEMRNSDGDANDMRVTEQIFISDSTGERSYPTLAINLYITAGSWLAWEYNQVWEDLGLTEYWADQP